MLWITAGIIASYLLGSVPTAYLFVKFLKGTDIRTVGSGNVGATNALRVLGKGAGITVLLIDVLKGFIPVFFFGNFLAAKVPPLVTEELLRLLLGFACISGHNWTIFLGFRGGKGIAATLGVLIGLAVKVAGLKIVLVLLLATWLAVFLVTRIVSLASLVTSIALPVYMVLFKESAVMIISGTLLCAFVFLRHWPNIKRLLKGREPRLNFKKG